MFPHTKILKHGNHIRAKHIWPHRSNPDGITQEKHGHHREMAVVSINKGISWDLHRTPLSGIYWFYLVCVTEYFPIVSPDVSPYRAINLKIIII